MMRSVCNVYIVYDLSVPVCCISDVRNSLSTWTERLDVAQKLLSLLNSYTPKEVRQSCLGEQLMFPWHLINSFNCVHSYEHWNILSLSHDGVDEKAMILFLWQRCWTPCWSCTRTTSQKRLFLSSMAPISTGTKRLLQVGVLTPKRRRLFRLSWFTLGSDCEPLRCC